MTNNITDRNINITMMLIDNLIKKIGNDKLLHFLVGFCISSVVLLLYFLLCPEMIGTYEQAYAYIVSFIIVGFVSVVKEFFDDTFDEEDIFAAEIGAGIPVLISLVVFL